MALGVAVDGGAVPVAVDTAVPVAAGVPDGGVLLDVGVAVLVDVEAGVGGGVPVEPGTEDGAGVEVVVGV